MVKDPNIEKWVEIRGLVGGWNTYDHPSNVSDDEVIDVNNMVYDGGILQMRQGANKLYDAPVGESNAPLQSIVAKTSDGVDYYIGVYGNHFYLYHDDNEEWLRINPTYVPIETTKVFGWVNWNNGRSDDRLYGCNGVDNFFRWDICVSQVNGALSSGASAIIIDDATRFPASGKVVVKGVSTTFSATYSSKTGNQLNLSAPIAEDVLDNASIACELIEKSGMEIGKIVFKHGGRLGTANYYGGETTVWYSVTASPEDFTTGPDVTDASTLVISDGNGEITGAHDFGEFFLLEKEDSLHKVSLEIAADLGSKLENVVPLVSGQSIGPISQQSTVKVDNKLYFPTRLNGFVSLNPNSTGGQSKVDKEFLSAKIHNFVTKLGYTLCKSAVFDNKVFWSVALPGSSIPMAILMFDTLRAKWTKIDNKSVVDFAVKDNQLLYVEYGTGNVYRLFDLTYNDDNGPYSAYFKTKRYDFGTMCVPKTEDLVYIEGLMTSSSEFFIDVWFNEAGSLDTQTYRINPDTEGLMFSEPIVGDEIGSYIPGASEAGGIQLAHIGNLSFFRGYLAISNRNGFYNLQLKCYSNKEAFWGVSGIGFDPIKASVVPNTMVISPIS